MKISLQQPLPAIEIKSKGEIQLIAGKLRYTPWNSDALQGKVRTLIHVAGRQDSLNLNQSLIETIQAENFNRLQYETTTILNLKEANWGTGAILCGQMEQAKKSQPQHSFIVDEKGTTLKSWGLSRESSAVLVLDEYGDVLYGKDGALSEGEVQYVIHLLRRRLSASLEFFSFAQRSRPAYASNYA